MPTTPAESVGITTPLKKVPKAVLRAREALAEQGIGVTPDKIKNHIKGKELNNLANCFRQSMSDNAKQQYKALAKDDEKRAWLAQYILDPAFATCEGFNMTTAFTKQEQRDDEQWVTEEMLQGPAFLNSAEHARIAIKDLESRPHELGALAAEGVKQYKFSWSVLRRSSGVKDEAGTSAHSELTEKEYAEVSADIGRNYNKPVKRKAIAMKEPESEEAKRLKSAKNIRGTAIRKCKSLIDKAASECGNTERDLEKMKLKGYPDTMTEWFMAKIGEFKAHLNVTQKVYAEEATRVQVNPEVDWLEAPRKEVDNAMQTLETKFKVFKESVASDIKKLSG